MYYIWSLLTSALLFSVIQFNEYNKIVDKRNYNLFTLTNFGTFVILYIMITIIMYMVTGGTGRQNNHHTMLKGAMKGGNVDKMKSVSVDPNMLRKISDNVYTGFSPTMKSDT